MNKLKLAGIIGGSILMGIGLVSAAVYFFPSKMVFLTSGNSVYPEMPQQSSVALSGCVFPNNADMARKENFEWVTQTAVNCTSFQEAKLRYTVDPKNAMTWDNGFPSREDWVRRLKDFKTALNSQWQTYRNEQHGFEFNYPSEWSVLVSTNTSRIVVSPPGSQLVLPMVIDIQRHAAAPASGWEVKNGQVFLGKNGLAEERERIREVARVADSNGKFVRLGNDYGTFVYHNFYRHGEFFLGDDLFTVTQPLSVLVPDVGGGFGKIQQELLSKINSHSISVLVSSEMNLLDRVVASFKLISAKGESTEDLDK